MRGARPDPEFWRDKRVLVTGHTGFKGGWLSLWLNALGAHVFGFALPPEEGPSLHALARVREVCDGGAAVAGDLRDRAAVEAAVAAAEPDVVLHLAAQAILRRALDDPIGAYETNVTGTAHLLEALRGVAGLSAAVVVTTDKVYANDGAGRAFREDDPLGGADPYSASKAACEMVAKSYAASYFDRLGAPVATARGGNVIGGGDFGAHRLGPDCVRAALAGEPVRLRQPEATRPWQHVLDCLCGYLLYAEALALRPEATPRALNVGPAPKPEVTVREFADRMLAAMGADGGVLAAEEPGSVEAKRLAIDPGLARRTLGWRDHLVGDAAIASAADWYAAWRRGDDMQLRALGEIAVYQGATPPRPGARGAASAGAARAR